MNAERKFKPLNRQIIAAKLRPRVDTARSLRGTSCRSIKTNLGPTDLAQSQRSAARILCGAGYAVFVSFPPSKVEGMEHRAAHQSFRLPRPLLEDAGASRRSIAASYRRRAALSDQPFRLALALGRGSLAGGQGHDKPRASLAAGRQRAPRRGS